LAFSPAAGTCNLTNQKVVSHEQKNADTPIESDPQGTHAEREDVSQRFGICLMEAGKIVPVLSFAGSQQGSDLKWTYQFPNRSAEDTPIKSGGRGVRSEDEFARAKNNTSGKSRKIRAYDTRAS